MFTKLGYGLFPKFTQDYGLFRPPNRASHRNSPPGEKCALDLIEVKIMQETWECQGLGAYYLAMLTL